CSSSPCTRLPPVSSFFVTDPAPTAIYTLSLHDALPISEHGERLRPAREPDPGTGCRGLPGRRRRRRNGRCLPGADRRAERPGRPDRKSTRLNSSHDQISYAVFCLKKKKTTTSRTRTTQP